MPLPTGGADLQWPPRQLDTVMPKLGEWSAWYSGDAEDLAAIYRGKRDPLRPSDRPTQHRGGVVGKVARWFWGQPTPAGQQRTKLHIPVAADIATASADLLYAEELALNLGEASTEASARLDAILEGNNWTAVLAESGEVGAALGGSYLRVGWDDEVASHPLLSTVHADAAWPEFRYGRLVAVTFWQIIGVNGQQVRRFLERHSKGRIEYGLYDGTVDKLGRRIPLNEAPISQDLTVDIESGVDTGFPEGLTAEYLPNIRPQRKWRRDPIGAHLGRSDFDQQEPLMDALDETWTSWMRDIRLGRSRIMVPAYMLESNGPGQGASFDLDQEVFTSLNIPTPEKDAGPQITPQQFAIRYAEHSATARELLTQILRGAGYGLQTFGIHEGGSSTATEVDSRDRRSESTREKKTRYVTQPIGRILTALSAVDAAKFGGRRVDEVRVEFPPASMPSVQQMSTSLDLLNRAEAISTDTKVRMLHPDWDDTKVGEEVGRILTETGRNVVDVGGPLPDDAPEA